MPAVAADGPAALADLVAAVERRQPDGPLAALTAAEAVAAELVAIGDRLIGFYVERARHAGHSWADIGSHVGISRQAAQQRFAPRWGSLTVADLTAAGGVDQATGRVRTALAGAEHRARALGHDAIEEAHLLLAVLDDGESLATKAVAAVGAGIPELRRRLGGLLDGHADGDGTTPPLSVEARRSLGRAATQALTLGHNYVGTEHVLLGIAATPDQALASILGEHGLTSETVRIVVRQLLDEVLRNRG
jgi:hypothetical protein